MVCRLVLCVLCFLLPPQVLQAEISGQDDPSFISAISLWLDGSDEDALAALADLTQSDNRAAQIFLGLVAQSSWYHAHVTADLPRAERNALLKAPGGLSGRSWLQIAAKDTPLAALLLKANMPYSGPQTAIALFDANEIEPAFGQIIRALNTGAVEGVHELALLPAAIPLTHGFLYNQKVTLFSSAENRDELLAQVAALGLLPPEQRAIWPSAGALDWHLDPVGKRSLLIERGNDLALHKMIGPLVAAIEDGCPGAGAFEAAMLQGFSRGRTIALYARGPVESLLPSEIYVQSRRFLDDLRRRALGIVPQSVIASDVMPCLLGAPP